MPFHLDGDMLIALGSVLGLLILASTLGRVLAARVTSESGRRTVDNLIARVRAWWGMCGVFALVLVIGPQASIWLFAMISFLALREFITLTPTRVADYFTICLMFFVLIPLNYYLLSIYWYGTWVLALPTFAFMLIPLGVLSSGDHTDFLSRVSKLQWSLMACVFFVSHAPALLTLECPGMEGKNYKLLFFFVLVAQLSDVLQYVFGKLMGRRRIAPLVSPNKTWEGFLGGLIATSAVGMLASPLTPFAAWQAALLSAIIVTMGFFGGLTLSAVKRDLGVKDWGAMIPGHGGMMDRIDSICFAAPVFFHLVRYYFVI